MKSISKVNFCKRNIMFRLKKVRNRILFGNFRIRFRLVGTHVFCVLCFFLVVTLTRRTPQYSWASVFSVERLLCKRPIPICRLFFKIDLLTDIAALCLTDFIDWKCIHLLVGIFDPACGIVAPMDEGTILVYCCPSIFSLTSSPPSQTQCTVYTDSECLRGGGWGVNCAV
jgi:hypothetical protein